MEKIGIFICNYNKADMAVRCVEAAMNQSYHNTDICVIDNASTDSSVEQLENTFGEKISIVKNKENLGGSGGFGRAIRMAVESDYGYFMLLDNDAFLDNDALKELYDYMSVNKDVGICGAKILNLQQPKYIQDYGGHIDRNTYQWGGIWGGTRDDNTDICMDVDYVASCALLARTDAVREFGFFPEENFIYWDDIEWSTKCKMSGYRVVVNGKAKAFHNKAFDTPKNLFLRYYATRNRLRFFSKYLSRDKMDDFYNVVTCDIFTRIFCAEYKDLYGTAKTYRNAFNDFIYGITGRAEEGKIPQYNEGKNTLLPIILKYRECIIDESGQGFDQLRRTINYIASLSDNINIIVKRFDDTEIDDDAVYIRLCAHITSVGDNIYPAIYVDKYMNHICSNDEYVKIKEFSKLLMEFQNTYKETFMGEAERLFIAEII